MNFTMNFTNMDLSNLCVLVTGGSGYIGSHIVQYLLTNGAKLVRILDINNTDIQHNNLDIFIGDITNKDICNRAMKDINVVCHQAAQVSVPKSFEDIALTTDVNIVGTINLLEAAKNNGIKRFIFASSCAIYGDNSNLPLSEKKENIKNILSPYALTKYTAEYYIKMYTNLYGIEGISLRYFNVYGGNQKASGSYASVIPKFIETITNNKAIYINGDGTFSRDFVHINDVVKANIICMTIGNNYKNYNNIFGNSFNIGSGKQVCIIDLFNKIKYMTNSNINPIFRDIRNGDIPHSVCDYTLAEKYLGFRSAVDFDDGLKQAIEIYTQRNKETKKNN